MPEEAASEAQPATAAPQEVETLAARLLKLETSDRLQAKQIRLIQKINSGLIGAVAIGFLLNQQAIQSEENRQLLERIAIGVVAAGFSGLGLSGFVETKELE